MSATRTFAPTEESTKLPHPLSRPRRGESAAGGPFGCRGRAVGEDMSEVALAMTIAGPASV